MSSHAVSRLRSERLARSLKPFVSRGSRSERCPGCRVIPGYCLCAWRPRVEVQAGVCLLMYDVEALKPSNTGWLIADVVAEARERIEREVDHHRAGRPAHIRFKVNSLVDEATIDIAAGDLGLSAARKFDCEAWVPTQGTYRELTSTSNCTTFQARRLATRYRDENGKPQIAATLNGTLATTRWLVAILENHQQPDGSVRVPEALVPYVGRSVLQP